MEHFPGFIGERLFVLGYRLIGRKIQGISFSHSKVTGDKIDIISLGIHACASSVVELWFLAADFPKGALGADGVTKAKKV